MDASIKKPPAIGGFGNTVCATRLWATGAEGIEEVRDIEEIEQTIAREVRGWLLGPEGIKESRHIEEVELAIVGQVRRARISRIDARPEAAGKGERTAGHHRARVGLPDRARERELPAGHVNRAAPVDGVPREIERPTRRPGARCEGTRCDHAQRDLGVLEAHD